MCSAAILHALVATIQVDAQETARMRSTTYRFLNIRGVASDSAVATPTETDRWQAAERMIVRVPESAFPRLPQRVRHRMRELGCLM